MKNVYLLEIPTDAAKNEIFERKNIGFLPCSVRNKIAKTTDGKTKTERIYAYSLLCKILKDEGLSCETVEKSLLFDEKGKPYLKDEKIWFSVSHTEKMAAVAVSRRGKIGIDTEKIGNGKSERIMRVIARFCKDTDVKYSDAGTEITVFTDNDGEISEVKLSKTVTPFENDVNFIKWTALEAVLKLHGTGFESICNVKEIAKELKTLSAVISLGDERYAVSVSEEKVL